MENITVNNVLALEIMKGYRLAAGSAGLSHHVNYVTIYDAHISEVDSAIPVFPDDIYLTFLFHGKDDPDYIVDFLRLLIRIKASAVIIFDEYLQELPPLAVDLCEKASLPVIFIDRNRPYSLIISSIMELKITAQQQKTICGNLDAITNRQIPLSAQKKIIAEINPNFRKKLISIFIMSQPAYSEYSPGDSVFKDNSRFSDVTAILNQINRQPSSFAIEYKGGIQVLLSFGEKEQRQPSMLAEHTLSQIRQRLPGISAGVSDLLPLDKMGEAIIQSHIALATGTFGSSFVRYYSKIGVSRILVDFEELSAAESFYQDVCTPILQWDQENDTCLWDTMLSFVDHDMDYKKTGNALYAHENTIRYRINKIKSLIPYGKTEFDFYETISAVSKIHRIRNIFQDCTQEK